MNSFEYAFTSPKIEIDDDEVISKKSCSGSGSSTPASHRAKHKSAATTYADFITRAILSTPDARLTLAEIYDWMASNVPGLHEQRHLHSSKGWKNAVRHTLSVNNRFHKISRVGRPSWWTVDAEVIHKFHPMSNSNKWVSQICLDGDSDIVLQSQTFRSRCDSEPSSYLSDVVRRSRFQNSPGFGGSSPMSPRSASYPDPVDTKPIQTVEVFMDDGAVGFVNIQKPVYFRTKVNEDSATQTDDEEAATPLYFTETMYPNELQVNGVPTTYPYDPTDLFLPELATVTEGQVWNASDDVDWMSSVPNSFNDLTLNSPSYGPWPQNANDLTLNSPTYGPCPQNPDDLTLNSQCYDSWPQNPSNCQ